MSEVSNKDREGRDQSLSSTDGAVFINSYGKGQPLSHERLREDAAGTLEVITAVGGYVSLLQSPFLEIIWLLFLFFFKQNLKHSILPTKTQEPDAGFKAG